MLNTMFSLAVLMTFLTRGQGQNLTQLLSHIVFVDPKSFAVHGVDGNFRNDSFTDFFNPTNTTIPFIQVFDHDFLQILGPNASIYEVASNSTVSLYNEAPVYIEETDELFFVGSIPDGSPPAKISMAEVEKAIQSGDKPINIQRTPIPQPPNVQFINGGTNYKSNILYVSIGHAPSTPPSLLMMNPHPPYNATILLDNFYGRKFNSLNDLKVHPKNGKIFFTDPSYGAFFGFTDSRPMPRHVYVFDPDTSTVRVVADGFDQPNGIAFNKDGNIVYVCDSGAQHAEEGTFTEEPATIYAFDIDSRTLAFTNRRVFAYIDTGVPDGIQVDLNGNVYTGCGDGVQVFSPTGKQLGKFYVQANTFSTTFAGPGRIVILAGNSLFVAKIASSVRSVVGNK